MHLPADYVHAFVGPPRVLSTGVANGPLAGTTLAVKDVVDVAGVVTGAGNPAYARDHEPATENATAVAQLVAAGAIVVGKTITDELAYSIAGRNVHYGTPTNVAAPGHIPGGSSAGSAAAVAAALCDLGLGTDTGGSIRVPASYCGIIGWRPTFGAVADSGIVHLARSFDTVGLLARDPALLLSAADALLGEQAWSAPVTSTADVAGLGVDLAECAEAFRLIQGYEAWAEHGAWIIKAQTDFGPDIAERFAAASQITADDVRPAWRLREAVRKEVIDATAGGRVLIGPATAGGAPAIAADAGTIAAARSATMRLTCVAGLAGAPVVVLPLAREGHLPLGIAHLGAPGSDRALLHWAARHFRYPQ
ncbi:amidase family protein [Mycobacterium sp.]|uniref:amidase family protein n=1 Tax=Mycobacterium sp. TaxID=1785 RepID=UPI002CADFAFC|nr:amidase family protein [Mycobacterium sp.]HME47048.1 amidase family protein [Mycobacterium sp.]